MNSHFSYRDPAAYVIFENGLYYRIISQDYREQYAHLMNAGLYDELVEKKLILKHSIVGTTEHFPVKLLPEQLFCLTYPYEWSMTQWVNTALTLIEINQIALKYGMILKDATPFNFCLHNGRIVLIDFASFDFFIEGKPWIAYRQFCEELLGPVMLMHYNGDQWGKLTESMLCRLPLQFISAQLPLRSYLNTSAAIHIHLHGSYFQPSAKKNAPSRGFSSEKLNILFATLAGSLKNLKGRRKNTLWEHYYETGIENNSTLLHKQQLLRETIEMLKPSCIIDLGCNSGLFSLMAAKHAEKVIAVDFDPTCIDKLFQQILNNKIENITPVVSDLTLPTPGLGWLNKERFSLFARLKGDMVLGLALIHHLAIGHNVPLELIAEMFAAVTSKYCVVEFIGVTDPKINLLLEHKSMPRYSESIFFSSFEKYFECTTICNLPDADRKLYVWEKK